MKKTGLAILALLISTIAYGDPCTRGVTIQPASPVAGEMVSIAYADPYRFFFPEPILVIDGNQIRIEQSAVVADPYPGHIPCGEKTLQVGALQAGNYEAVVHLNTGESMAASFIVRPSTVSVCELLRYVPMTGPGSGTLAASAAEHAGSVLLHFENRGFSEFVGDGSFQVPLLGLPAVRIVGDRILVTQTYIPFAPQPVTEHGPGYFARFCQAEDVSLGALAPGKYTLVWTYITGMGPVEVTATVSSGLSPRGRAVRGH